MNCKHTKTCEDYPECEGCQTGLLQGYKEVIESAVNWFNAVDQGFAAKERPDIARTKFYVKAKEYGFIKD